MLLLGGFYLLLGLGVLVALPAMTAAGGAAALFGALMMTLGLRQQRIGPAVMLNNAAHDLLTQGRYDEALALLDTIPAAQRTGLVGMAILSQRAYVRFAQGDAPARGEPARLADPSVEPSVARGGERDQQREGGPDAPRERRHGVGNAEPDGARGHRDHRAHPQDHPQHHGVRRARRSAARPRMSHGCPTRRRRPTRRCSPTAPGLRRARRTPWCCG